jgi:2-dehydro-3-deoxygluconokinase
MAAAEVVTAGEAMLLLVADPGVPLASAHGFRAAAAGAETNVAVGLARLGHRVEWLGRLGDDPAGQAVLRRLRADGVGTTRVRLDPDAPTGLLLRDSHPARAIEVQYARAGSAASRLRPEELDPDLLSDVRLLHVTGITAMLSASCRASVTRLLELARAAGTAVSLDPNLRRQLGTPQRWRAVVGPLLPQADLVFAGADELAVLTGRPAAEAATDLVSAGVGTVVVKGADKSATAHTGAGTAVQPAFDVPAVDPVGAGDAFAAGYLSAWLRGLPTARALAEGAAAAALAVQCVTDTDGLPDRMGLDRMLAAHGTGARLSGTTRAASTDTGAATVDTVHR